MKIIIIIIINNNNNNNNNLSNESYESYRDDSIVYLNIND